MVNSQKNVVQGYKGQSTLKKSGQVIQFTPDQIVEVLKCREDPIYFIENYMKIIEIGKGEVLFKLRDYQKEMILSMFHNRYTIIATARQSGKCVAKDTPVVIQFLDSERVELHISTIHAIFTYVNKYISLYYGENSFGLLGQQIFENLFQTNKEEAKRFSKLWRTASCLAKIDWWKQLRDKYSASLSERTLYSTQVTSENVCQRNTGILINDSCVGDDVSYTRWIVKENIPRVHSTEGSILSYQLSKDFRESQETLARSRSQRAARTLDANFGEGERESSEDARSQAYRSRASEDARRTEEILRDSRAPHERNYAYVGTSRQVWETWAYNDRRYQSENACRQETSYEGRDKKEAQRKLGEMEDGRSDQSAYNRRDSHKDQREMPRVLESKENEKFIETEHCRGFFIESDSGWVELIQSHKTVPFQVWTLATKTKLLQCADKHVVYDEDYNQTYVKDLRLGQKILTDNGSEEVLALIPHNSEENMYDLGVNHPDHRYYTTGILSKNSTAMCGFLLWFIVFHENKTVALLANKGETAREILGRVRFAYHSLPNWLQQGVETWNKGKMELENGSRVLASATKSGTVRGYSIDILLVDEAAFIEDWDEFYGAVYPTISSAQTTKIIQVSTPNGLNHFHKTWISANDKNPANWNGFHPIMVTWQNVPGRDEKWRKETLASMNFDQAKFDQEYSVEFQGSSGTLISGWKLKEMASKWIRPIYDYRGLCKYVDPIQGHRYVTLCDVSRGKGRDYSAFSIIDVTEMPYQQVCTYRNNMTTPMDYATLILQLCKAYNQASVLVEVNDIGEQVGHALHYDYEYDAVLFTENAGRAGKRISSGFSKGVDKGIRTTKQVKSTGCSILKLLIEQNQLVVNDVSTVQELSTFSLQGQGYEAEDGCHDDLVMGLVLFAWLTDQQYFKDYTDINTLSLLRDQTDEQIADDLLPFGFVDYGQDEEEIVSPTGIPATSWL